MDNLENRVLLLEERVQNMDKTISIFDASISRFDKAIDKLNCTLADLGTLFLELKINSKSNADNIRELKEQLKKNDSEHVINLAVLVQNNIIPIAIFLFLLAQNVGWLK